MIKVFRLKGLLVLILVTTLSLTICLGICKIVQTGIAPKIDYTIVIDAGHGGRDGGCVGENGSIEKDLNLAYSKTLQKMLEDRGVSVIMTRTDDNGLYSNSANNKKLSDMKARAKIITNYKPNLVVSIHMNSFALKSAKGARVFHKIDSEPSKTVGDNIQKSLHYYCSAPATKSSAGDYYILNCTNYTSVLIECGYLSNAEEEYNLNQKEYREKLVHSIFSGILIYLGLDYY